MRDTDDLTDVVFENVTFALVGDFLPPQGAGMNANDAPIGISYARGSIALHDGADGDSAGLTFRNVTMDSNDNTIGVANELAMLQMVSVGGAKLVLDNLTLTGMNPGTATLGAQFNISGNGAADAIEIVEFADQRRRQFLCQRLRVGAHRRQHLRWPGAGPQRAQTRLRH